MSPLEITIAINYAISSRDFRDGDFSASAVREAIYRFVDIGFLRLRIQGDAGDAIYVATDMCMAYVEKLCSIGIPKRKWVYED